MFKAVLQTLGKVLFFFFFSLPFSHLLSVQPGFTVHRDFTGMEISWPYREHISTTILHLTVGLALDFCTLMFVLSNASYQLRIQEHFCLLLNVCILKVLTIKGEGKRAVGKWGLQIVMGEPTECAICWSSPEMVRPALMQEHTNAWVQPKWLTFIENKQPVKSLWRHCIVKRLRRDLRAAIGMRHHRCSFGNEWFAAWRAAWLVCGACSQCYPNREIHCAGSLCCSRMGLTS